MYHRNSGNNIAIFGQSCPLPAAAGWKSGHYFSGKTLQHLAEIPQKRNIAPPSKSPDGGTGRRARLKILLSKGSAGSIPVLGTF
jgi:hypothetical protein